MFLGKDPLQHVVIHSYFVSHIWIHISKELSLDSPVFLVFSDI